MGRIIVLVGSTKEKRLLFAKQFIGYFMTETGENMQALSLDNIVRDAQERSNLEYQGKVIIINNRSQVTAARKAMSEINPLFWAQIAVKIMQTGYQHGLRNFIIIDCETSDEIEFFSRSSQADVVYCKSAGEYDVLGHTKIETIKHQVFINIDDPWDVLNSMDEFYELYMDTCPLNLEERLAKLAKSDKKSDDTAIPYFG